MNPPPQQIDYAPARQWYQRVNWRRWATWASIVTAVAITAIVTPRAVRQYQIYLAQEDAIASFARYAASAPESGPAVVSNLFRKKRTADFVIGASYVLYGDASIVFLGKRTARGGDERLVIVWQADAFTRSDFDFECYIPATPWRGLESVSRSSIALWPSERIQTAIPQPLDEIDASHFTFVAETLTRKQTFDGWLMPDDTVKIEPRDEPATAPPH